METLQKLARSLRTARASDLPGGSKDCHMRPISLDHLTLLYQQVQPFVCLLNTKLLSFPFIDNDSAFHILMPMVMQNQHKYIHFASFYNFPTHRIFPENTHTNSPSPPPPPPLPLCSDVHANYCS